MSPISSQNARQGVSEMRVQGMSMDGVRGDSVADTACSRAAQVGEGKPVEHEAYSWYNCEAARMEGRAPSKTCRQMHSYGS